MPSSSSSTTTINTAAKVPSLDGNLPLKDADPVLYEIIQDEERRQFRGLELIASENFTSQAVLDCLGSALTNKYSEGQVGRRYYGGNQHIDRVEQLCKERCLAAFGLSADEWTVNVQPYSGSTANFATLAAVLQPHDRLMGLDLPAGGHLTHGYYTARRRISSTSIFFESLPYTVDPQTGLVDWDDLERTARIYMPKLIIVGASAYPRDWDYARAREIADSVGALLMCDMAHYAGLVAAGEHNSPFEHCDIVTSTTHKSLRGPRAGIIFARRDARGLGDKIDFSVFPGCQGGPHNHQIAAIATQMREVATPQFRQYAAQVKRNAKALVTGLQRHGYKIVTDGTDNHLVMWDLRPQGITGSKVERLLEMCDISVNKNSLVGDKSAMAPMGIRLGSPALTSRGFSEDDFGRVADFLHRGTQIALAVQADAAGTKLTDFLAAIEQSDKYKQQIAALRDEVVAFSSTFGMPGFDANAL